MISKSKCTNTTRAWHLSYRRANQGSSRILLCHPPQANTQTMRIATKTIRIFTTRRECVAHRTKLFATDEVVYNEPIIQNVLSFIDHMSCCADTYVSLGGSNGCADQLTNWDGTQKLGLGAPPKKKSQGLSR